MTVTPTGDASGGAGAGGDGTCGGSSTARGGQSSSSSMAAALRADREKAREPLRVTALSFHFSPFLFFIYSFLCFRLYFIYPCIYLIWITFFKNYIVLPPSKNKCNFMTKHVNQCLDVKLQKYFLSFVMSG